MVQDKTRQDKGNSKKGTEKGEHDELETEDAQHQQQRQWSVRGKAVQRPKRRGMHIDSKTCQTKKKAHTRTSRSF